MINLSSNNGLMTWDAKEIWFRNTISQYFALMLQSTLVKQNAAWRFIQIEAPVLIEGWQLNKEYNESDMYCIHNNTLRLRPETTAGSYLYAKHLLDTHSGIKPPFCVWQMGKSFRMEQDQPTKFMRLKEFYQQEFQCIYSNTSKNDYYMNCLNPMAYMIQEMVGLPVRVVPSERLPNYSEATNDVEVQLPDGRYMELCSISRRNDFPNEGYTVLEVAIGLDRCVYIKFLKDNHESDITI